MKAILMNILIVGTLLISACSPVNYMGDCKRSKNVQKAKLVLDNDILDNQDNFTFDLKEASYSIDIKGNGLRKSGNGKTQKFNIPVEKDYALETVFLLEYESDLILVYSQGAAGEGTGNVVRLNSQSLELTWGVWVPGLNIGYPVIENNRLYLTAYSMVLSYELAKGEVMWKHDSLKYNTRYYVFTGENYFNSFDVPQVCHDRIIFTLRKYDQDDNNESRVIVYKDSGLKKVISVY